MTTTEQPTLPGSPEAPAANIPPRHRPWHYMLVTKHVEYADDDDMEGVADYDVEGYDDLEIARLDARGGYEEEGPAGIWDNWAGVWIAEPEWSDEIDMHDEGWARYDLRPEVA